MRDTRILWVIVFAMGLAVLGPVRVWADDLDIAPDPTDPAAVDLDTLLAGMSEEELQELVKQASANRLMTCLRRLRPH